MRALRARDARRRERRPPYATPLNPVEAVWSGLEYGQLAHVVPDDPTELGDKMLDRLIRLRCEPKLLSARGNGSELPFPEERSG